ncbi:META domain-containing protein [Rubricoccus marinus]|uniref:DUF306 domain-containing protein n=1 Tax=Rubricoccus marinus TaxID=716817 RepID=A0A259TZ23_9BACT|nr:META domain-containing protein [Rubricoccus marinus]OZC03025.1 hypothetical protein BSZ36_08610 [Rubricoccus marinus]
MTFPAGRFALLALAFIVAGCSGPGASGGGVLLAGSSWSLERIVYPTGEVARGSGETVAFGADGSLSIASCNTCQGRYRMRGATLSVEEGLGCTRMACPTDAVQLEQFFATDVSVRRDGSYLIVTPEVEAGAASGAPQLILLPTQAPTASN